RVCDALPFFRTKLRSSRKICYRDVRTDTFACVTSIGPLRALRRHVPPDEDGLGNDASDVGNRHAGRGTILAMTIGPELHNLPVTPLGPADLNTEPEGYLKGLAAPEALPTTSTTTFALFIIVNA